MKTFVIGAQDKLQSIINNEWSIRKENNWDLQPTCENYVNQIKIVV